MKSFQVHCNFRRLEKQCLMGSFGLQHLVVVVGRNEMRQKITAPPTERRGHPVSGLHAGQGVVAARLRASTWLAGSPPSSDPHRDVSAQRQRSVCYPRFYLRRDNRPIVDRERRPGRQRRFLRRLGVAAFGLLLLLPAGAQAGDSGELSVRLATGHELAHLKDPAATYGPASSTSITYVPRLGVQLGYGLTNWLEFNVAGTTSWPRSVSAQRVSLQGGNGSLTADYADVMLPAGLAVKWDPLTGFSLTVAAAVGPAFVHWDAKELRRAEGGRFNLEEESRWEAQWLAKAELLGQWRSGNWFALSIGPYAISKSGGDLHVGLNGSVEFIFGAGPSF